MSNTPVTHLLQGSARHLLSGSGLGYGMSVSKYLDKNAGIALGATSKSLRKAVYHNKDSRSLSGN